MEGTWSLRVGPEVHSGLSLFRLEALVRSGTLEGHHLVFGDGRWMRVDEVPYLQRQLKLRAQVAKELKAAAARETAKKPTPRRVIGNVVELFPERQEAELPPLTKQDRSRQKQRIGQFVMAGVLALLAVEGLFLAYTVFLAAQ